MGNHKTEEDHVVISVKSKKIVVNYFIDVTNSENLEQKVTVFTFPPFC